MVLDAVFAYWHQRISMIFKWLKRKKSYELLLYPTELTDPKHWSYPCTEMGEKIRNSQHSMTTQILFWLLWENFKGIWNIRGEFIYILQNIKEDFSLRLALFTTAPLALASIIGKEEEREGIRNFKRNYYQKIVCSILCNKIKKFSSVIQFKQIPKVNYLRDHWL